MCGINAIFAYSGAAPPIDRDEVIATRECMHSRGPDAADVAARFPWARRWRGGGGGGTVPRHFDPAGAAGFFLRGTVPEPFTMYRAIRALPAGSYMYADADGIREPIPYFSIAATLRDA